MEKKILIALIFIAATSLLWVFHFMGRDSDAQNFMTETQLEIDHSPCQKDMPTTEIMTLLKPGFAVHQSNHTSYVLRSEQTAPEKLEKVRLTIEQPTSPRPAATECEQKRIDNLKHSEEPHFCIETLQIQPSKIWPEEYEFHYQRWRGNWSDLEVSNPEVTPDSNKDSQQPEWGTYSPHIKTPPSI